MNAVTLSSKFQISIPKQVRDEQKWKAGQKLAFVPQGKRYFLVPVPTSGELFGIAKGANPDGYRDREDRF
jgi:AbrB family looped-hinge helix DNA binding protein